MKNNISRAEISEAIGKFLNNGGKIKKINFDDNGFLINNDLLIDSNYNEKTVIKNLKLENEPDSEILN
jgi:hypothetical protein